MQSSAGLEIILFERKSLTDLLASIKDGRYEEQSYRLTHASEFHSHNIIYIIEGQLSTLKSHLEKKIVYSCIASLHAFKGFSVMRTSSLQETAELVFYMAEKIDRTLAKGKVPKFYKWSTQENNNVSSVVPSTQNEPENYCTVVKKTKKDNITTNNIGEIMLCQIPGISALSAMTIMKNHSSFQDFLECLWTDPSFLDNIYIETQGKKRKLSKNIVSNIKQYLGKNPSIEQTPVMTDS
jgi:ERCC4-type nuclease